MTTTDAQHTRGEAILAPQYDGLIALGERPEDADHCARTFNAMTNRRDGAEDLANARRLALCWNCHDELLEALEKLLGSCVYADAEGSIDVARGGCDDEDHRAIVVEVRAAIAKAKGETK